MPGIDRNREMPVVGEETEVGSLLLALESELAESRSRLRRDIGFSRLADPHPSEIVRLRRELAGEIESLQQQLAWTQERLVAARQTPFARISRLCDDIENRLAPLGSRRRRVTATVRTGTSVLVQEGARVFLTTLIRWIGGERGYWKRLIRASRSHFFPPSDSMLTHALLEVHEPRQEETVDPATRISGWTVDPAVGPRAGPGVDAVRVHLGSRVNGRLLAETRPALPHRNPEDLVGLDASYEFCGFQVDVDELPPGSHLLTVCSVRASRVIASVAVSVTVDPFSAGDGFHHPVVAQPAFRAFTAREEPSDFELRRQRREATVWSSRPSFDLVSTTDGATADIESTLESLCQQTYGGWTWHLRVPERCRAGVTAAVACDRRVLVVPDSGADASADSVPGKGEFVIPIRSGDRLAPSALHAVASEIRLNPRVSLVIGDEDRLDSAGRRRNPFFKPQWSTELALSTSLVSGFAAFRRLKLEPSDGIERITDRLGAWGASLRFDREGLEIRHLSRLLLHRRSHDPLLAEEKVAAMIADDLRRRGRSDPEVRVSTRNGIQQTRLRWNSLADRLVSVIVPSRTPTLAARCLSHVVRHTTGVRFEVIVVATAGSRSDWERAFVGLPDAPVEIHTVDAGTMGFNFQSTCNAGRQRARGDALLFLNDDVVVSEPGWLGKLDQWLDVDGVGAVGPKLVHPGGTIQHAGVVVGMTGFASHAFRGEREGKASLFASDLWYRGCSALTAACLLMPTRVFDEVGGFDDRFAILFGDVDLCLRLREAGYRLVYTPDVTLEHEESRTRRRTGAERVPRRDWELFTERWLPLLAEGDPFYSPCLTSLDERIDFKRDDGDTPIRRNEVWMSRLPRKPWIDLPDDLATSLSRESRP